MTSLDPNAKHDGFDEQFFENLYRREAANFWFVSRNRLIIWALEKYFPQARTMLEIGCGTGFVMQGVAERFPDLRMTGAEYFVKGLEFARSRLPAAEFLQMDARNIPFKDHFDVIGAFDVFEHINEDSEVLAKIYEATKPGGGILVTVPQHMFLWSKADEHAMHKRRYSRKELFEKVEKAGFKIARSTSFVTLLMPAMLASRAYMRLRKSGYDSEAEMKAATRMRPAEMVMSAERALIRIGLSLPFGGSLLLAAVKNPNP